MKPFLNSAYLNTAGCGLISEASLQAGAAIYNEFAVNSSTRSEHWREKEDPIYRKALAEFLQADEDRLAFIPNFSYAMNMLVQSLTGKEKILLYKNDYPSITAPFIHNGFPVHLIDSEEGFALSLDQIEKAFQEEQIQIMAIGHVQWQTGFKIELKPLSDLCRKYS